MANLLEPSPSSSATRKRRRWKPTGWQQNLLQHHFEEKTRFPSRTECEALAEQTGESARRIRVWFQNHRQRQEEEEVTKKTCRDASSSLSSTKKEESAGGEATTADPSLPMAEAIPMTLLTPLSQRFASESMDPQEMDGFFNSFQSVLGVDVQSGPTTPVQTTAATTGSPDVYEEEDVDTSFPPMAWLDLPPPEWAVFAACSMRAFPTLQLETILTGIQKVLPFEGHARLFEAAKQGALAHAVANARETAPDIAETDIKYWSERLLLCEARSIASYCFRRVAGLHGV